MKRMSIKMSEKKEDEKFIIEKIFIYICGEKEFGNG